jgi:hypothetical protein
VAIAAGNPRIPALLDPLPPELDEPLAYTKSIAVQDFNLFVLLDKPVVPPKITGLFDHQTRSITQLNWSMTDAAPWTTEPGKQIMGVHTAMPHDEVAALGGPEVVYAAMRARSEEMYPGLGEHIQRTAQQSHRHHWLSPITIGPKIPRTVPSVDGLWFVGDGSAPTGGIWTEAAASCGILGARAITGI